MTTDPLQAWLIHKTPTGDTSLRLRFFTHERGMIDCHYRGGRAAKKNAALQAFTPLWLLLNERHQWLYVKSLENSGLPLTLTGPSLFAALYVNELIFHTVTPQEHDELLFTAYQNTLRALETHQHQSAIEISLRRFEQSLLSACGYSLTLTTESNVSEPIKSTAFYQYRAGQGFKESETGIPGLHLLAIANDNLDDPQVLKTAKRIMRHAIDHLLGGRQLKSRSLYVAKTKVSNVE